MSAFYDKFKKVLDARHDVDWVIFESPCGNGTSVGIERASNWEQRPLREGWKLLYGPCGHDEAWHLFEPIRANHPVKPNTKEIT